MNRIGFLCSRVRAEEKLLLDEFERRGIEVVKLDPRTLVFDLAERPDLGVNVVFDRGLSFSQSLHCMKILNDHGIRTINPYEVINTCGDKFLTSLALIKAGIPTPRVMIAFTPESALEAVEQMGYPCVIKPTVGSWGRLIARINDRDAAEAVLEHKTTLGSYQHSVIYVQEYLEKAGRDIRAFVVNGKTICAIYRSSEHWITNTARGAKASNCPVTKEIDELCRRATTAVNGEIVAVDLVETSNGLTVLEINHTMEFRNSIDTTGVNIPAKMIDYIMEISENEKN